MTLGWFDLLLLCSLWAGTGWVIRGYVERARLRRRSWEIRERLHKADHAAGRDRVRGRLTGHPESPRV